MFQNKWPNVSEMKELGKIHTQILRQLKDFIKPGLSAIEVEERFIKLAQKYNVESACLGKEVPGKRPYPANLCIAINEQAIHVYPTKEQIFKEGDLVTIDLVLVKNHINTDAAFSMLLPISQNGSRKLVEKYKNRQKLLNTAYKALKSGINNAVDGKRTGDIGYAISNVVYSNGFSVLMEYGGHGIGYNMWEEPFVPNYGEKGKGYKLKTGMFLAIEPLVAQKGNKISYIDDWRTKMQDGGDFVQVESTVMVGKNAPIFITEIV